MNTADHTRHEAFRRTLRRATFVLAAAWLVAAAVPAMAQSEEGIKAAFLYNFVKFTEWPAKTFADANTPVTVGFVGADSLADLFEKNITGKNANGRDFVVKKLTSAAGAEKCQVVFLGEGASCAEILNQLKGKPVLTVGQSDEFMTAGGMIRFIRDGAKIGFDLNLGVANTAELKLDTKLRQIARNAKGG